jgi:hypothetical protein
MVDVGSRAAWTRSRRHGRVGQQVVDRSHRGGQQVTVTVTSGTRYAKRSTADTSAIAAGQCLMARGAKDGSGNLAATAVNLRPADNGKCGGGRRHGG